MLKRIAPLVALLIATGAHAQNFPPQVPISMLPTGGVIQTGDLFPANRAGVTYGVTWPPAVIPFSVLPSQPANVILGTISIGSPAALAMPSCNTTYAALTWANGVGPGCHTIQSSLSGLLGATTTSSIDNANWQQTWTWNSLTTGTALSLSTSSATSGTVLQASINSSGNTGYAGYFSNTATTTGYAVYANGSEAVTGSLTVNGNAALSGTTTINSGQVLGGNALLTTITSTTANTTTQNVRGALAFTSTVAAPINGVYSDSANSLSVSTSGVQVIQATPKVIAFKGALPSVTSGAGNCGTSPVIAGDDTTGRVTVGSSTNGGVCPMLFASAKTTAPVCVCDNETNAGHGCTALGTSTTGTALTATTSYAAAESLGYHCFGYQQ